MLLAFHPKGQPLRREEPVAETKPFYCELLSGRSRVSGDVHARFWESPGVRFPRATQQRRDGRRLDVASEIRVRALSRCVAARWNRVGDMCQFMFDVPRPGPRPC